MSSNRHAISAHSQDASRQSLARMLWLLPIIFIIHDGEELLTMPSWVASHQPEIARLAKLSEATAKMVQSLPTTTTQTAVAIGFVLLLFVVVTAGASISCRRGIWLYAFNATTGDAVPGFPVTLGGGIETATPAVGGGRVFVGDARQGLLLPILGD